VAWLPLLEWVSISRSSSARVGRATPELLGLNLVRPTGSAAAQSTNDGEMIVVVLVGRDGQLS
jgi:hypothetical protein